MPGFVKTVEDERLWAKAKEQAAKQGKPDNWAYVTAIYKSMKGGKVGAAMEDFKGREAGLSGVDDRYDVAVLFVLEEHGAWMNVPMISRELVEIGRPISSEEIGFALERLADEGNVVYRAARGEAQITPRGEETLAQNKGLMRAAAMGINPMDPNYDDKVRVQKALQIARKGADRIGGAVGYLRDVYTMPGDRYGAQYKQWAIELCDAASYDEVPYQEAVEAIERLAKHLSGLDRGDRLPGWAKGAAMDQGYFLRVYVPLNQDIGEVQRAVSKVVDTTPGGHLLKVDDYQMQLHYDIPEADDRQLEALRRNIARLQRTYPTLQAYLEPDGGPIGKYTWKVTGSREAMKRRYPPPAGSEERAGWDACLDTPPDRRKSELRKVVREMDDPGRRAWASGWVDCWETNGDAPWGREKVKAASPQRVAYNHLLRLAKADLSDKDKQRVIEMLAEAKGAEIPDSKVHELAEDLGIAADDLESYIYSIASELAAWQQSTYNPGGAAEKAGIKAEDFPKETIEKGIEVELEHTEDRELAKKIVLDHLAESADYYDALEEMEAKLEKKAAAVPHDKGSNWVHLNRGGIKSWWWIDPNPPGDFSPATFTVVETDDAENTMNNGYSYILMVREPGGQTWQHKRLLSFPNVAFGVASDIFKKAWSYPEGMNDNVRRSFARRSEYRMAAR